ncbi:MAG: MFS transporter [Chloroflexota bacterium]
MDRKWWLVIAGCVTHAVNTGFSYFGMSAFFPSFEREFGWSRAAISGAFSLARAKTGVLGPLEGYLTDRVGAHRMLFIGLIICVLGFYSLSLVASLPMLYAVIIFGIVMGSSLGYNMPISVLIAKIFRERRSLAFGIFRMGPGISGPLVPLVGWMIAIWGWRTAAVISALIIFAVGLPIAFFIREIYYREERDRAVAEIAIRSEEFLRRQSEDPQFTLGEALRHRVFWYFSLAMALRHMVTEGVSVHFVILLVDRGWTTEAASSLLGLSALIGAPARIGMGWLGDLLDKRRLMIGMLVALGFSVFLMGQAAEALIFIPCMVVYSLAYGGLASLQEPIRADYFGTKAFATIQGMSRSVQTVGTFIGPLLAGILYDLTRSYSVAFGIFAIVSLASAAIMSLAQRPQPASSPR